MKVDMKNKMIESRTTEAITEGFNCFVRDLPAFKGLSYALLSGVFYSSVAVIVKLMDNMHPGQLAVYRFLGLFIFSIPDAFYCSEKLLGPRNCRLLLILRGLFGATNVFLNFLAYRYLPLGVASVIIFSVPAFVTVAARIFMKEPCGLFQTVAVGFTILGIILTTKIWIFLSGKEVPYLKEDIYGFLAAFGSLAFSTCRYIVLRKLRGVPRAIIMFHNGWISIVETSILTALIGTYKLPYCGLQGFYIILIGILSYVGQILLTVSLQCEHAGPVSTVRSSTDILLAFLWQIILFHDIPDSYSITGAVLVGVSVIMIGFSKWIASLPTDSTVVKQFGWMIN